MTLEVAGITLFSKILLNATFLKNLTKTTVTISIENNSSYSLTNPTNYLKSGISSKLKRFSRSKNQFCLVLHESKELPLPRVSNKMKNFFESKHKNYKYSNDRDGFHLEGKNSELALLCLAMIHQLLRSV
uniref:Uncharacterized protein n=1 Tax=Rhizophagus irregularis (strain DAOM 181602 / DAOM 197198 / MUCL 43194) TaxID=747089 RepID=U9T5X1_RHIID